MFRGCQPAPKARLFRAKAVLLQALQKELTFLFLSWNMALALVILKMSVLIHHGTTSDREQKRLSNQMIEPRFVVPATRPWVEKQSSIRRKP
jgi:hypothetical protein